MRKILIALITVILVAFAVKAVTDKIKVEDIEILGIKELEAKDNSLKDTIKEGEEAIEEYDTAYAKINTAYKKLSNAKEEYEQKVAAIAEKNTEEAKLLQNYSIEFLWIEIGGHQKKEGVKLDLSFTPSGESSETDILTNREVGIWDINFTVTGEYEAITDFIYDIEGDSKLGFGIENFTLNPESTSSTKTTDLVAKFTCSDVRIYTDSLKDTSSLGGSIFNGSSSSSNNSELVDDSKNDGNSSDSKDNSEETNDDNAEEKKNDSTTNDNNTDNKQNDNTTNSAE